MRKLDNILVTGGAGFIGSNFIRLMFNELNFKGRIINLDKLTYAGNPNSLEDIREKYGNSQYTFIHGDICNSELLEKVFKEYKIDTIIHFAAESHVDRSISGPADFIQTNIMGTFSLLEAARKNWIDFSDKLFHHVSTDEVFGSLGETGYFFETTPYDPRSPYSSSKASSDHLVNAYFHTYNLPITMSNCTNNYGPFQFPEKLIPLIINNITNGKQLPIYGDGKNIRDWIYVDDHNYGVWDIVTKGRLGETYNLGGENEWENIKLVHVLCEVVAKNLGQNPEKTKKLITYVTDRPGHDRRYAINCDKVKSELGWKQRFSFTEGLSHTVEWYLENSKWIENIASGEYTKWLEKNYHNR